MPHLLLKGVSSGIKFDGLNTTGNRYYVGFMNMERSQYYDIYLNLVHEKHHVDTPEDVGEASSEYYAYKEAMNHLYFKYASPDYQNHVYREFGKYERLFLAGR